MADAGNKGMKDMIQVVNRLQDAFASTGLPFGLELPQIVVVGGQSAGKSSVLENFVGKDFLPRGAGIVTRRPLILQLHHADTEYAEFLHQPNRRFTNFAEVRREIEAETDRETGGNKGISSNPINLRVYSPNVLDLTLVDLPGMTRVPVGDQPPDIERQIRNMVMEFVTRENSLILAVSPANSDLANSDAMNIAKEVDPSGDRTIGVITKLDLMDEGTHARDVLLGKLVPLKRGYIGVVNRSQKDIDGNKDIKQAMEAERMFFLKHPNYKDLVDQMGTPYLQQVLNRELNRHIGATLPKIKNQLRNKLSEAKKDLAKFQETSSPSATRSQFLKLIQEFASDVEGDVQGLTADIDTDKLAAGARINRLFYHDFADALALDKLPDDVLRREIAFAIRNIYGVRTGLFTPDLAFNATVTKIIASFREQVKGCVDLVAFVLKETIEKSSHKTFDQFPKLKEEVEFTLKEHVEDQEELSKKQLMCFVDAEMAFQNVRHEDFITKTTIENHDPNSPEFTKSVGAVRRDLNVTTQVLEKGWLTLHKKGRIGMSGKLYFVLKSDTLSWFKDEQEEEYLYTLQFTPKVKLKEDPKKFKIILYNIDGKNVVPDSKVMELACGDEGDMQHWVLCLENAGVYPEEAAGHMDGKPSLQRQNSNESIASVSTELQKNLANRHADTGAGVLKRDNRGDVRNRRVTMQENTKSMLDPEMQSQTATIKLMVDSYLKIVSKTVRDLVPKYIMLLLVNNTVKFITMELSSRILADNNDVGKLMAVDGAVEDRHAHLKKSYEAAKQALDIINECSLADV